MRIHVRPIRAQLAALPLFLCTIPSRPTHAQLSATLVVTPGARVRAHVAGGGDRVGRIVSMTSDTLVVGWESGETVAIPMAATTGFDVNSGRRAHKTLGAGIGLLAGALLGYSAAKSTEEDASCGKSGDPLRDFCDAVFVEPLTVGGALMGTVAGFVTGALWRTERWTPLVVGPGAARVSVTSPPRGAGPGLGLSVSF